MRVTILVILLFAVIACRKAPTTSSTTPVECESLTFDLTDGTMNGVRPNQNQSEIREWLPCYSRFTPNGGDNDCGGGLIYDPFHFAYYTYYNKYLEVKKGFKGTVTDTLFNKNKTAIRALLKSYGDSTEAAVLSDTMDLFPAPYGCIRIHYGNASGASARRQEKDYPQTIAVHYCDCQSVDWCK